MLWYISFLLDAPATRGSVSEEENAFTISEVMNKGRQKLQIKQSVCNYANAVLTPSMLLTLEATFAR